MPVSRVLRRLEEDAAAASRLTMWQYAILSMVEARPGLNQLQVAERLGYSKNRIVGDLDRLEALGLLRRTAGPDRRANVLALTAAGRRMRRTVQGRIRRAEEDLLDAVRPGDRPGFLQAIEDLARHIRRG